jgi:hypothetical protein
VKREIPHTNKLPWPLRRMDHARADLAADPENSTACHEGRR